MQIRKQNLKISVIPFFFKLANGNLAAYIIINFFSFNSVTLKRFEKIGISLCLIEKN
jgi:hypothetical protein